MTTPAQLRGGPRPRPSRSATAPSCLRIRVRGTRLSPSQQSVAASLDNAVASTHRSGHSGRFGLHTGTVVPLGTVHIVKQSPDDAPALLRDAAPKLKARAEELRDRIGHGGAVVLANERTLGDAQTAEAPSGEAIR